MKRISILIIFIVVGFGFAYVNANKSKNFHFTPPSNFALDNSYYLPYFPTEYNYTGAEKISILIPPERQSKLGLPKTKTGQINPKFLQGKMDFNEQFGIQEWTMTGHRFTQTQHGERLEIEGSYKSFNGAKVYFVEHHYISPTAMQSIHLFFPDKANDKVVQQAKASLQTFNPNIN